MLIKALSEQNVPILRMVMSMPVKYLEKYQHHHQAILQMDNPMFIRHNKREFLPRVKKRNRRTAAMGYSYDCLDYEFVLSLNELINNDEL